MFIHNGKEVEIVLPIAPVKALGRHFSPGVGRCSSRAVCSEQRCTGLGFDANVLLESVCKVGGFPVPRAKR